ncbi:hypothetical protein ES703_93284 [subsurface metagenome]
MGWDWFSHTRAQCNPIPLVSGAFRGTFGNAVARLVCYGLKRLNIVAGRDLVFK